MAATGLPSRSNKTRRATVLGALLPLAMVAGGVRAEDAETPVRGVVRALDQATISTDLQAPVLRIGFRDGERFRKGDLLIEFNCARQRAELAAVEAQRKEMQLNVDNNLALQRAQAVGRHDLEISRARLAKAGAESDAHRARLEQCQIIAPFNGRVSDLGINAHETPQQGKPFISIVAEGAHEIDLVFPSDWLRWIKPGMTFSFSVDETRTTHAAHVVRLGAVVDAISQTMRAVAILDEPNDGILPGMSGSAAFKNRSE